MGDAPLVLNRLPKLLVDDFHLRGRNRAVSYGCKPEEIARKLRAACMEDKSSAHSEHSTEKAGFENHIVSRRSLTGPRRMDGGLTDRRPIVLSEGERGEVDFMRKLDKPLQRCRPRIEGCCPGLYLRDFFETTCQRLQEFLLLSRRAKKDAGLVHADLLTP